MTSMRQTKPTAEVYVPNTRGRPPLDPKKRRVWDMARKALSAGKTAKAVKAIKKKPKLVKLDSKPGAVMGKPRAKAKLKASAPKKPSTRTLTIPRPTNPAKPRQVSLDKGGKLLSLEEARDIISLCRNEGVRHLKMPNFEVELAGPKAIGSAASEGTSAPRSGAVSDSRRSPSTRAMGSDPHALRAAEEAQLLIDDPLGFEQSQIDAHLALGTSEGAESFIDRDAESDL